MDIVQAYLPYMVSRLTGIKTVQLKYWKQTGELIPVRDEKGRDCYTEKQIEEARNLAVKKNEEKQARAIRKFFAVQDTNKFSFGYFEFDNNTCSLLPKSKIYVLPSAASVIFLNKEPTACVNLKNTSGIHMNPAILLEHFSDEKIDKYMTINIVMSDIKDQMAKAKSLAHEKMGVNDSRLFGNMKENYIIVDKWIGSAELIYSAGLILESEIIKMLIPNKLGPAAIVSESGVGVIMPVILHK